MFGYKGDFNSFSEMVVNDGRVIRRVENQDGYAYTVVERGVTPDDFMIANETEWMEVSDEELAIWLEAAGE